MAAPPPAFAAPAALAARRPARHGRCAARRPPRAAAAAGPPPGPAVPPTPPATIRDASLAGGRLSAHPPPLSLTPGPPVAPHALLLRVPLSEALVVPRRAAAAAPPQHPPFPAPFVTRAYWRASEWDARLVALLAYHRLAAPPAAPASRYAAALPLAHFTAADLTGDALADVQYGPAQDAVDVFRYRADTEHARFLAALADRSLRARVPRALYRALFKLVHARAFAIPSGAHAAPHARPGLVRAAAGGGDAAAGGAAAASTHYALVPVLDRLEHAAGRANARLRWNAALRTFDLVAGGARIPPGRALSVDYGAALTNDDLFLLHGSVQVGNPADVHLVDEIAHWAADDPVNRDWNLFDAKLRSLRRAALAYDGRKYAVARTRVDPHLVAAMRVLLAGPREFADLVAAAQAAAGPAAGDCTGRAGAADAADRGDSADAADRFPAAFALAAARPLSVVNEARVWSRIHVQLRRLLDEYPTSLQMDEEMLALRAASSLPRDPAVDTPLLFRVEKKRILADAIGLAGEHAARLRAAADALGLRTGAAAR